MLCSGALFYSLLICLATCTAETEGLFLSSGVQHRKNGSPSRRRDVLGDLAKSLNMTSGLAASRRHSGILYAINDNHGEGQIYMLDAKSGSVKGVLVVQHTRDVDWEDMAVGPCPDSDSCIFVADTGHGTGYHSQKTIYRVKEPGVVVTQDVPLHGTYRYSWSEYSSEAMVVDTTGNVYVLSEHTGSGSKLGELPSFGWNSGHTVAVKLVATLHLTTTHRGPLAADISPDGRHLLVKTYSHVLAWDMPDRNIRKALQHPGKQLHYSRERQGEAVAWAADGKGYYTIGQGSTEKLHYHSYP